MEDKRREAVIAVFSNCFSEESEMFEAMSLLKRKRPSSTMIPLMVAAKSAKKESNEGQRRRFTDIISRYSDPTFKTHFRISRSTVEALMQMMPPIGDSCRGRPGLRKVNPETAVLMSLWTMGNRESFREVAARFRMSKGHAHREFVTFCDTLCSLRSDVIKWPRGREAERTMRDFDSLQTLREFASGRTRVFPGVIGCIDDAHISIAAPSRNKPAYCNRKQFTSVVLQAVCDSRRKFIDVFAGWPGSCHEADIWVNSPLYGLIEEQPDVLPEGAHLLGDDAYPLSTYLIVPYEDDGHLPQRKRLFNVVLKSLHAVIDQAFVQLFGRFRRLKHLYMFRLDRLPLVIVAGCILHNVCITQNDEMPALDGSDEGERIVWQQKEPVGEPTCCSVIPSDDAVAERDAISDQLFMYDVEESI